jgi:hypothetical protein
MSEVASSSGMFAVHGTKVHEFFFMRKCTQMQEKNESDNICFQRPDLARHKKWQIMKRMGY